VVHLLKEFRLLVYDSLGYGFDQLSLEADDDAFLVDEPAGTLRLD